MRNFVGFALFGLLLPPAVNAADFTEIPLSTQQALPVTQGSDFDWSGFYTGVYGTVQSSAANVTQYGAGVNVGVNAQFDFYLLGAEVAVEGLTDGAGETSYGQILGRAGLVATDDVLVYAAGGYGIELGAPSDGEFLVGGGVELSVTESVSLRAQYLHSFPTQGNNPKDRVTFGANFHF